MWAVVFKKSWKRLERSLSPEAKLDLICEKLKLDFPEGERPRQTISILIDFRNTLAHGRSSEIAAPKTSVPVAHVDKHFARNSLLPIGES